MALYKGPDGFDWNKLFHEIQRFLFGLAMFALFCIGLCVVVLHEACLHLEEVGFTSGICAPTTGPASPSSPNGIERVVRERIRAIIAEIVKEELEAALDVGRWARRGEAGREYRHEGASTHADNESRADVDQHAAVTLL